MSSVREAAFAGRFYPAQREQCEQALQRISRSPSSEPAIAAIAPHAGWSYSGPTAALAIASLASRRPETIVIFGAVHVRDKNHASLYSKGSWDSPLGEIAIDEELASCVCGVPGVTESPDSHRAEHSIEVEIPIVKHLLGSVMILPIMVRPGEHSAKIGERVAMAAADFGRRVAFLASTDLTHYGAMFGFEPHGPGEGGQRWAKDVNDRRFVDVVSSLDADAVVPEAELNRNACGAGAVSATVAAACALGCERYVELEHLTSADVDSKSGIRSENSVGYQAGVFALPV